MSTAVRIETTLSLSGMAVSKSLTSDRTISQVPMTMRMKAPTMDPTAGTATT